MGTGMQRGPHYIGAFAPAPLAPRRELRASRPSTTFARASSTKLPRPCGNPDARVTNLVRCKRTTLRWGVSLATSSGATRQCPACQAETPAENKFCGECGSPMPTACPSCGHQNPAGQKFCGECGAGLAGAAKPSAVVPPATPVTAQEPVPSPPATSGLSSSYREADPVAYTPKHLAEKILTSKSAIEGERKRVTVMFADVSGLTAMSERLDAEDVHAIMDRAFEVRI